MNSKPYNYQVLIVGAGMAGISAAQHLIKNGVESICMVEAQNRIGGRIHTVNYGSGNIELGANWIHGTNQANCIFNLANQYNLVDTPLQIHDRRKGAIVHSDGQAIDQRLSMEIFDKIREIEFETTKLKREPNKESLKEFCDEKIKLLLNSYPLDEHRIIKSVYNYFQNYMSFHAGDNIELVSAWGYGAYNEVPNDIVVKEGFGQLVNRIADEVGKQNILLNHEVVRIDWNSLPIRVEVKTDSQKLETFTANYVLITTSVGVLKASHKQLFVPHLPNKKIEAIERMGFGKVGKLFLHYSNPFWSRGTLENLKFARSEEPSSQHWTDRVNGFEEVIDNPNVIQAWISGEQTLDLELSDEHEIVDRVTELLRQFTGDPSLPRPDSVLVTDWCSNRFICGSYSYPTTKTLANDHETIGEPITIGGCPALLFAGEATHHSYFSTVHGARLTALNQANKIIKSIQSKH